MDHIARFIDCAVPVLTCNLRCSYCYIAQQNLFLKALPAFKYSPEEIAYALRPERLGGICHLNLCGGGETMLPPEMTDILRGLLAHGHYIAVVTNGTVSKRFAEVCEFPREYLNRLLFKFSFHWLELNRTSMLDRFVANVKMVRDAGCSFSVELTPNDETIECIPEIIEFCKKNFGALCHITVARNETERHLPILTNLTKDEYRQVWGQFESPLFDFKLSTFEVKRKEFCYAGQWTAVLNLGSGILKQCYYGEVLQNIFDDPDKPIRFKPIGANCPEPHCHNSHVWLTLGNIPVLDTPPYAEMRNRVCEDGTEWLTPEFKEFISQKLYENNEQYSEEQQVSITRKMKVELACSQILLSIARFIRKRTPDKLRAKIAKDSRYNAKQSDAKRREGG